MKLVRPFATQPATKPSRVQPTPLQAWEDAVGTCNTCPGELDSAESCYQRDPTPPAYPWRALGAVCAVVICVPLALHLVLALAPAVMQVAAR